jgi:plastocyanin
VNLRLAAVVLAAVSVVLAGCGDDSGTDETSAPEITAADTSAPDTTAPAESRVEVSIASVAFGPDEITVPLGTTVVWTNDEDAVPHTSTSDDGLWNSGTLDPGESFEFTFDEPGTFAYFCRIHPSMTATIIVEG